MCKRCTTPSYDSLLAQKMESNREHVFLYSLHEIALKKFSLQSKIYQIGVIFSQLSIL